MDKERKLLIEKYEEIKQRWDNDSDIKRILPETYDEICLKLEGLKLGCEYTKKDVTKDFVSAVGALLCGGQMGFPDGNGKILPFAFSDRYQKSMDKFLKKGGIQ